MHIGQKELQQVIADARAVHLDGRPPVNIIADWIKESKHMVVFTGAGVSTESAVDYI
jgi:hypothetical protein